MQPLSLHGLTFSDSILQVYTSINKAEI